MSQTRLIKWSLIVVSVCVIGIEKNHISLYRPVMYDLFITQAK